MIRMFPLGEIKHNSTTGCGHNKCEDWVCNIKFKILNKLVDESKSKDWIILEIDENLLEYIKYKTGKVKYMEILNKITVATKSLFVGSSQPQLFLLIDSSHCVLSMEGYSLKFFKSSREGSDYSCNFITSLIQTEDK